MKLEEAVGLASAAGNTRAASKSEKMGAAWDDPYRRQKPHFPAGFDILPMNKPLSPPAACSRDLRQSAELHRQYMHKGTWDS